MTRNLVKRLQKIEAQLPPEPRQLTDGEKHAQYWTCVELVAIGYYLGNPEFSRVIPNLETFYSIEACWRVLGYEGKMEERDKAVQTNDPVLRGRLAAARIQLFAKFGLSDASESDRLKAFKKMRDGFPESCRQELIEMAGCNGE
jgi:hypothetical protein